MRRRSRDAGACAAASIPSRLPGRKALRKSAVDELECATPPARPGLRRFPGNELAETLCGGQAVAGAGRAKTEARQESPAPDFEALHKPRDETTATSAWRSQPTRRWA